MKHTIPIHCAWALVAIGTFALGRMGDGASGGGDSAAPAPGGKSATRPVASGRGSGGGERTQYRTREARSADQMRQMVEDHQAETDPMQKRRVFFEILEGMTPGNAEATVLAWKAARGPVEAWASDRGEYSQLLQMWGRVDGVTAMAHAEDLESNLQGWSENSIMQGWGFANPQESLAWVQENRKGDGPLIQQLLWGIAERDIDLATDFVLASPDDVNAGVYIDRLARQRWTQGVDDAQAWAERLPDGAIKGRAVCSIAEFMVPEQPKQAASWLTQYAGAESGKLAIRRVAKGWAEKNPYGAARWVEGLPDGENRDLAIRDVVLDWARRRPGSAEQYMQGLEAGPTRDKAVAVYAGYVMQSEPQDGMAWVLSMENPTLREEALVAQGRAWMQRDPAGAAAWLDSDDLADAVAERIRTE